MAVRAARIRTESMAVRLSKQPISEGYALWDKGYTLGAMRLFIFKAESVPPFQLAGCLDAIAHLMMDVQECQDAEENFSTAAEKYEMIQQPILAKLMRAKIFEAQEKSKDAIAAVRTILKEHDDAPDAATRDQKTRTGLARCYHYLAELLAAQESLDEAKTNIEKAVALGWDRVHCGYVLQGTLQHATGELDAALASYQAGMTANANCLEAVNGAIAILKEKKQWDEMIPLLDKAIALQPRLSLIHEKSMALSNAGHDTEALTLLDKYISCPPQEEMDPNVAPLPVSALYKAKAAILADGSKFADAIATLEAALALYPNDTDIKEMLEQIKEAKE